MVSVLRLEAKVSRDNRFGFEEDDDQDDDESSERGALTRKTSSNNGEVNSSPTKRRSRHRVESMPSDEEIARKQWNEDGHGRLVCFLAASCEDPSDIAFFECRRRYKWLRVGGLTPKKFEHIPAALGPVAVNRRVVYVVGPNAAKFIEIMKSIHDGSPDGSPLYVDWMVFFRESFAAGVAHGEKIAKKRSKP